jgi:hypothetical protein
MDAGSIQRPAQPRATLTPWHAIGATHMPFQPERCKPDVLERFWSHVDRSHKCWTWTAGKSRDGYGQFSPYNRHTMQAHRFIDIAFNGPHTPEQPHTLHTCDNPACVRPSHLFRGSNQDNVNDCIRKQRHTIGERNRHARLTADDIRAIRERSEKGGTTRDIANDYGIHINHVRNFIKRKRWTHI